MPGGRLTIEDRRRIAADLTDGLTYAQIARRLGRPTSTVSREVARNGGPDGYRADEAHHATGRRARRRRRAPSPEPPRTTTAHGRDADAVRRFTEQFATLLVETGVPRMPARVLTCLFTTDDGSLTAAELVQSLRVSPASVSKAVGYLEGVGLLRREREQRRERYHIDDDVWLRAWTVSARSHAALADIAIEGAQILDPATAAGARVAAMGQFFARLGDDMAGGDGLLGGPEAATVDDALTALAGLVHAGTPLTVDQLAGALGWPAQRVRTALDTAERHPDIGDPIALRQVQAGAYTITARPNRLTPSQREALTPT